MFHLAEIEPNVPIISATLITGLLGLAAGYRIVLGIIKDHRELSRAKDTEIKPSPLVVTPAKDYVERADFNAKFSSIESRLKEIEDQGEARLVEMHKRHNEFDRKVGELIGEVKGLSAQARDAAQQAQVAAVQAASAVATAQAILHQHQQKV